MSHLHPHNFYDSIFLCIDKTICINYNSDKIMMYPPSQQRFLIHMMIYKRKKRYMHQNKLWISNRKETSSPSKTRKRLSINARYINGVLKSMDPTKTLWFRAYIQYPNTSNKKFSHKFRKQFRMPHAEFIWLLSKVSTHHICKQWKRLQHNTNPISLLLRGSLRCLVRSWCFDDLEKATGISEKVHRVFS